ncbi:MAG TPA: NAD-dependent epimerase/dehydratase family protein [Candidatus Eisenbacteria bacterium]|nr:NAD-dependent epimerase/dehydratase family protein [Candidatus Eisenbacteria bacterium]
MRILVTGGAGFIGSNVADGLLARGHEVAVLDNLSTGFREFVPRGVPWFEADVLDGAALERAFQTFRPEVVCHHAAQIDVRRSVTDPVFDARVNILGGLELLRACTRHEVRKVVYASTGGAIYGEGRTLPATEQHPINPEAPYGASKHALEHYLYLWKLLFGLDYTVLRYPNVYGPRQNPHGEAGVNAIFIGLMLEGKRPRIFGTGEQVRDYLYVDDVVAANVLALDRAGGEILNLGTGVGTSVLDIFRELQALLGFDGEPVFEPARPGEIQRITLDATRAREQLGWGWTVGFREGLARTIAWTMEQRAERNV